MIRFGTVFWFTYCNFHARIYPNYIGSGCLVDDGKKSIIIIKKKKIEKLLNCKNRK